MANYLCAIVPSDLLHDVCALLDDDVVVMERGGTCVVLHPAEAADPDGMFIGHAIDHEARQIKFASVAPQDRPKADDHAEGAFIRVAIEQRSGPFGARWPKRPSESRPTQLTIFSDLFGMVPRLYFATPTIFAVSDSMSLLCALRARLNLPNTPNEQALQARLWTNSMATQPLSCSMIVRDVTLAPPGSKVTVTARRGHLSCQLSAPALPDLFASPAASYEEQVAEGAVRARDVIGTVARLPGARVSLDLSGGLDSRVCFAAAVAAGVEGSMSIGSGRASVRDLEIATRVAETTDIRLNAGDPPGTKRPSYLSAGSRLAQWAAFNRGLYDSLYGPGRNLPTDLRFKIGGHGAEVIKGNYGWRPVRRIVSAVPTDVRDAVQAEMLAGLVQLGVPPHHRYGSEWHYLGYRNAIHSGRVTMSTLLGVRPLLQRRLAALAHAKKNPFRAPPKGAPSAVSDLLVALSPSLAAMPFDEPRKDMTRADVDARRARLPALSPFEPYACLGVPAVQRPGSTQASQHVAVRSGFDGTMESTKTIRQLITRALDSIPSSLRVAFEPTAELARGIEEDSRPNSPEARASAKIFNLTLFE